MKFSWYLGEYLNRAMQKEDKSTFLNFTGERKKKNNTFMTYAFLTNSTSTLKSAQILPANWKAKMKYPKGFMKTWNFNS